MKNRERRGLPGHHQEGDLRVNAEMIGERADVEVGRLLTVLETAARLGVKPATIRSWILKREKLEIVRIGRCVRITERSVIALINNNLVPPEK